MACSSEASSSPSVPRPPRLPSPVLSRFSGRINLYDGSGQYTFVRKLGNGSQGSVCVVQRVADARLLVVKRCAWSDAVVRELRLLQQLNHPFIVRVHDHYIEQVSDSQDLCIVMDYAAGGDLQQLLNKLRTKSGRLQDVQISRILVQLLMAVDHCHRHKVLHRDIKPANVFLAQPDNTEMLVFLGDFGVSKKIQGDGMGLADTITGTPYYLAPEIIRGERYGEKSDIWSLGVLLYQLLTLELPFGGQSLPELARQVLECEPEKPRHRDAQLLQAVRMCLSKQMSERPSAKTLLRLPAMFEWRRHYAAKHLRSAADKYLSPAVYLDNPAPARRRVPSPKMALRGNRHWPKQAPAEIDSPTTLLELTQKAEASTRNSLADGRNSVADTDRAREKERRRSRWSRGDWGDGVNTRLSQTRQSNVRDSQTANSQGGTPQNRISQSRMSQSRVSQSRASQARSRESRSDKAGDEGKSERRSRVRFSHRTRDRQKESKSAHASKREGEPEEADDTYRSEESDDNGFRIRRARSALDEVLDCLQEALATDLWLESARQDATPTPAPTVTIVAPHFELDLRCFFCRHDGRLGRLFLTAMHLAFWPLTSGKKLTIHLDKLQSAKFCLIKFLQKVSTRIPYSAPLRVVTPQCIVKLKSKRKLRLMLVAEINADQQARERRSDAARIAANVLHSQQKTFSMLRNREAVVAALKHATNVRGATLSVYSQAPRPLPHFNRWLGPAVLANGLRRRMSAALNDVTSITSLRSSNVQQAAEVPSAPPVPTDARAENTRGASAGAGGADGSAAAEPVNRMHHGVQPAGGARRWSNPDNAPEKASSWEDVEEGDENDGSDGCSKGEDHDGSDGWSKGEDHDELEHDDENGESQRDDQCAGILPILRTASSS